MESVPLLAVIVDPPGDPAANMAVDERLAHRVRQNLAPPTLRTYRWDQPAISLGRRQRPEDLPRELIQKELPLVRRPTGGGAVVHDTEEFTYALAMPLERIPVRVSLKGLACLLHQRLRGQLVSRGWVGADELLEAHVESEKPSPLCFSAPVAGDLLYRGRKAAGSALRVWREAFLIQGSIQGLPVPARQLRDALIEGVCAVLDVRCPQPVGSAEAGI